MKAKKRQKLCYNCDGEVDLEVIFCPYCGVDLLEEKNNLEETPPQLYPPPYVPGNVVTEEQEEVPKKEVHSFVPLMLLTLGVQAFLIGILLFILSENGSVHLQFDAKTWLFYLLFSIPVLYFGIKKLQDI